MYEFVTVYFFILVLKQLIALGFIAGGKFPKVEKRYLGYYVAKVLINLPFCLWAAWLLWG